MGDFLKSGDLQREPSFFDPMPEDDFPLSLNPYEIIPRPSIGHVTESVARMIYAMVKKMRPGDFLKLERNADHDINVFMLTIPVKPDPLPPKPVVAKLYHFGCPEPDCDDGMSIADHPRRNPRTIMPGHCLKHLRIRRFTHATELVER